MDHEGLARVVIKKPFINAVEIARNHSTEFFFQDAMSVLDQHLATVLSIRDGKVSAIDTYLSDVDMVNAFFVPK